MNELIERWREEAEILRFWGDEDRADVIERCTMEVAREWRERQLEELSVEEAVSHSGYTPDGLRKMVERGELENVGKTGSPRYRRGDLPRKASRPGLQVEDGSPDLAGEILRDRARRKA